MLAVDNMIIQSVDLIQDPLVSVVIPSYNRADTVGETIESIMNQKCCFDIEIVIGDDCSTDHARQILQEYQKKYPKNIVLLFHDVNIGLGANWATCVKHCRGKYLANCDNDDYWHNENKLQLQVDFLTSQTEYGVVHTDYRNHNRDSGQISEVVISNLLIASPLQQAIFSGKFKCCNATMMYRKSLIDKYINLDDYISNRFTLQDWNTWIILSKYSPFYCMPISTATFGIETESITRPTSFEKLEFRFRKEKECYRYVCNLFPIELVFDEMKYDNYVITIYQNFAFKKFDYSNAKKYSEQLKSNGNKSFKTKCTSNLITFYLFCIIRFIWNKISNT